MINNRCICIEVNMMLARVGVGGRQFLCLLLVFVVGFGVGVGGGGEMKQVNGIVLTVCGGRGGGGGGGGLAVMERRQVGLEQE